MKMYALVLPCLLLAACGGSADDGNALGDIGTTDVPQHYVGRDVDVDFPLVEDTTGDVAAPLDVPAAVDVPLPPRPDVPEADALPPFEYECEPMSVEACVTACGSAGKRMCLKEWGPCVPPDEFCGGCADEDCDGLVNELCPPNPECEPPPPPECPVAVISVTEGAAVGTGTVLHLSAAESSAGEGRTVAEWAWSVQGPAGAAAAFAPDASSAATTFLVDGAGTYLFTLVVWDDEGLESCVPAQLAVVVAPYPPQVPEVGCADGQREGFLDVEAYAQVAACSGAWDAPGVTPDTVVPTCGRAGGDDGAHADGIGCSSADLCATGWHVCAGWQELAAKSPTGCAGATPPDARPKSLFFALRQPSENYSVCGDWGDGYNDVFGCGNLGHTLAPDKGCGPLDRALASTQANSCGYNEAEPNLGPWECRGPGDSHLNEGALVTKKGCPGGACSYDGYSVASADKGGVLCCRD